MGRVYQSWVNMSFYQATYGRATLCCMSTPNELLYIDVLRMVAKSANGTWTPWFITLFIRVGANQKLIGFLSSVPKRRISQASTGLSHELRPARAQILEKAARTGPNPPNPRNPRNPRNPPNPPNPQAPPPPRWPSHLCFFRMELRFVVPLPIRFRSIPPVPDRNAGSGNMDMRRMGPAKLHTISVAQN